MTSSQEMEQFYSYNTGTHTGHVHGWGEVDNLYATLLNIDC